MQFLIHILTVSILYGLKFLMLFNKSLYYKKAMRIISFQPQSSHSSPFFQKNNILKFSDKTMIDNIPFINKALLNNMLPLIFENWFQFYYYIHHESITCTIKGHLYIKSLRTNNFGKISVTVSTIHEIKCKIRWVR